MRRVDLSCGPVPIPSQSLVAGIRAACYNSPLTVGFKFKVHRIMALPQQQDDEARWVCIVVVFTFDLVFNLCFSELHNRERSQAHWVRIHILSIGTRARYSEFIPNRLPEPTQGFVRPVWLSNGCGSNQSNLAIPRTQGPYSTRGEIRKVQDCIGSGAHTTLAS